jgi:hypothetical protein
MLMPCKSSYRVFLFLSLVSGLSWADQVTMKNGDRVTGSIVKKDGKTLTIKTTLFGEVTAPWDQVASVQADKPVNVVLEDGQKAQGTIATKEGKLDVTTKTTTLHVEPSEVTAIRDDAEQKSYERMLKPGWGQLWAGTGSIGFAGTAGNARTLSFTTGASAVRITHSDKTSLHFEAIKSTALIDGKTAETARAVRGGIAYDHNANQRLFVNVFNDYEYDRFQNLDLRFVLGGGFGYHAYRSDNSRLDLVAGADYNRSSFATPEVRKSAELFWGDDYTLKLNGSTSLVQAYRMFNDLSHTGIYRVNFDLGLTTRFAKWLSWNVSLSDRYLNTPALGRKTNDFLYTTGVGIVWAR